MLGRLIVLLLAACHTMSWSQDSASLWAYARKHEGRFVTELPEPLTVFKLRFPSDSSHFILGKYFPREQLFVDTMPPEVRTQVLATTCKEMGSYIGKTAMGVTTKVNRRSCLQLIIEGPAEGAKLGRNVCLSFDPTPDEIANAETAECYSKRRAIWVSMSPDQYRALKAKGAIFEVSFEAGRDVSDQVVVREQVRHSPTINSPNDVLVDQYTVRGRLSSVRLIFPGGHVEEANASN